MDVSSATNLYATGPDGWLKFMQGVDELGKALQADITKYKGLLQQYARFHFDQATALSTPAFQPSSDILIQFQDTFDELERVVQSHVLKVKHSLDEPLTAHQIASVKTSHQDTGENDFLNIVAKAYETSMAWADYLKAARDPTRCNELKPYIIYLHNESMPDRRVMMIIHPPGQQETRESKFVSPPANGSTTILAPLHGISGLDWSEAKGNLVGNIDPYDNWHHTRRVDLCPLGRSNTIALYGDDIFKPFLVNVTPFKEVVSKQCVLLDAQIVYSGFMMYSNAFAFALTTLRDHPSFEATRCFDTNAQPLAQHQSLFM